MTSVDYRRLLDFNGRAFVVLGAGQGIGAEACHALAQAGARLACVDSDADRAAAIAAAVDGRPFVIDVTDRAAMQALLRDAAAALGPNRVLSISSGPPTQGRWRSFPIAIGMRNTPSCCAMCF